MLPTHPQGTEWSPAGFGGSHRFRGPLLPSTSSQEEGTPGRREVRKQRGGLGSRERAPLWFCLLLEAILLARVVDTWARSTPEEEASSLGREVYMGGDIGSRPVAEDRALLLGAGVLIHFGLSRAFSPWRPVTANPLRFWVRWFPPPSLSPSCPPCLGGTAPALAGTPSPSRAWPSTASWGPSQPPPPAVPPGGFSRLRVSVGTACHRLPESASVPPRPVSGSRSLSSKRRRSRLEAKKQKRQL